MPKWLPLDDAVLLRQVSLAFLRQPGLTREAAGALAMLQRYRANDAGTVELEPSLDGERRRLEGMSSAMSAVSEADRTAVSRNSFPPPDPRALESCLRERVYRGSSGRIENLQTLAGGYSKQTCMFDWVGPGDHVESYVLRRDCPPGIVGSSVVNEYPLLAALHRIGQPVPEPILAEDSYPLIPMPFIITRRLPGRSIGGPLGPGDDRSFDPIPGLAKMLAELHGVPAGELGVPGFSDKPFDRSMLLAHLGYWRDRYLADKGPSSPALDAALVFLEAELESGLQRGVVVHGDPGLYNLLFENDRVVGVVDWELAHFGSAAWDLAYVKEAVEAYGAYERFLNLYESYGGIRPPPRALAYYNVFRLLYCGTMCRNGLAMFNRGEAVGLDLLHVLCTMYPRYLEQLPAAIEAFSQ